MQEPGKAKRKVASAPLTTAAYIAAAPASVRPILKALRAAVRRAAPDAEERISYRMPAYFYHGVLVYFSAFKGHIGLFPPVREKSLLPLVAKYAGPKGNLRFPLSDPIPYALIERIVKSRMTERLEGTKTEKT